MLIRFIPVKEKALAEEGRALTKVDTELRELYSVDWPHTGESAN